MTRRDLVKILIDFSERSASSLASEKGLHRSNVTRWLKHGGSSVGVKRQDDLLSILGISNGSLDSTRVHRWTIDHNLEPLRKILSWMGDEFEAVFDSHGNRCFWGQIRIVVGLFDPLKSIRILICQRVPPMVPDREIQFLGPETIPHVKWLERDPRENLRADPTFSKKLMNPQSEISTEEFDRFFDSLSVSRKTGEILSTWEDFAKEMERRGITPNEAGRRILGGLG